MSAISNLKKAHEALAITKDDFTLQKFFNKFEENDVATIHIVGLESKYVAKFDKRDYAPGSDIGAGCLGFRTKFILSDGLTVGTFSNGAHDFFTLFATLMQCDPNATFNHIDILGVVKVELSMIDLGEGKSTYNFNIVDDEDSRLDGLSNYLPTSNSIMLPSGEAVNTDTGEITEDPETEEEPKDETKATTKKK